MTQIGRYEIVRRTGQTPLGTIYEAVDSKTRRTVAIQATASAAGINSLPARSEARAAFEESTESLGRLNHPNIRNLLAVEHADGRLFLVMEHLDARPLAEHVATHQTPAVEIVKILKAAAAALDYAHERGVFHPGLTPAHLLIDSTSVLKIAGFEIPGIDALPLKAPGAAERADLESSTPYRAPEFLCGEDKDGRADQFALAAITYELLSGRKLFQYSSLAETMAAIILGKMPDFSLVESKTTVAFRRVLERALASDAAQRYVTCTQMVTAMETAVLRKAAAAPTRITDSTFKNPALQQPSLVRRSTPPQLSIPERITGAQRKNNRRMVWMIAATVVVMIVMVGLIVVLQTQQHPTAGPTRGERTERIPVSPPLHPSNEPAAPAKDPDVQKIIDRVRQDTERGSSATLQGTDTSTQITNTEPKPKPKHKSTQQILDLKPPKLQ